MNLIRRTMPAFASLLVGAVFVLVVLTPGFVDAGHAGRLFLPPLLAGAAMTLITFIVVGRRVHPYHRLRIAVTPVILLVGAYGYLLIVDRPWARAAVIALSVAATYAYFDRVRRLGSLEHAEKADFVYFTYALHVAAAFFIFSTGYGLMRIIHVPVSLIAPLVAAALIATTFETLRRSGIRAGRSAPLGLAFGVVLTELFVAVGFLPTAAVVNATVLTVLFSLVLRVAMQVMHRETVAARIRAQVAVSLGLVAILLATARWI